VQELKNNTKEILKKFREKLFPTNEESELMKILYTSDEKFVQQEKRKNMSTEGNLSKNAKHYYISEEVKTEELNPKTRYLNYGISV
jgi:hypothetical protein